MSERLLVFIYITRSYVNIVQIWKYVKDEFELRFDLCNEDYSYIYLHLKVIGHPVHHVIQHGSPEVDTRPLSALGVNCADTSVNVIQYRITQSLVPDK